MILRGACVAIALVLAAAVEPGAAGATQLEVRATPSVGMAPVAIAVTAILGDVADEEELYCATVEWDWGDGSLSRSTPDCEPFDPEREDNIRRFYRREHVYSFGGEFLAEIRLLQQDKVVAAGGTVIKVLR